MKHVTAYGGRLITISAFLLTIHAGGSPLPAQSDGLEMVSEIRARTAIQLIFRNTSAKGIPTDPLMRKVREGVSKKSDPARIEAAVQLLAQRLEISWAALAPTFSVEELSAGADALQVGVPASTLRDLRKIWMTKPLTVPLGILYELVSREVPVAQSTKRVRELMTKGANDAQLAALSANVVADVAAGLAPDAALELRAKGVMTLLSFPGTFTTAAPGKPPIRPK